MRKKETELFYKHHDKDEAFIEEGEPKRRIRELRKEEFQKDFDQEPPHPHMPPHHRRPPMLSEEMIDEADLEMLLRITTHEIHRPRRKSLGDAQDRILKILSEEESMTQKNLQFLVGVRPGTISETITKMEEKNLLTREKKDDDKRHVVLRITEEGKKVSSTLEGTGDRFNVLSQEEKEELETTLRKLLKSWIEEEKEDNLLGE